LSNWSKVFHVPSQQIPYCWNLQSSLECAGLLWTFQYLVWYTLQSYCLQFLQALAPCCCLGWTHHDNGALDCLEQTPQSIFSVNLKYPIMVPAVVRHLVTLFDLMLWGLCLTIKLPMSPSSLVLVDPALQCTVTVLSTFLVFFNSTGLPIARLCSDCLVGANCCWRPLSLSPAQICFCLGQFCLHWTLPP
jgi:hypothetical protein